VTLLARALPVRVATSGQVMATNATLVARRAAGRSAGLYVIELDVPLAGYRPGQYVALGMWIDGAAVQRPYSVVSLSADRRRVELLIRRVPGGALSPRLHDREPGGRVRIGPPRGVFVFDASDRRRRLFVGAGTGVAPLLAMLQLASSVGDAVPATLVHAVSFADEFVFGDRLASWHASGLDLDYRRTVSRPAEPRNAGWQGRHGRAEVQLLGMVGQTAFRPAEWVAYVCGNPPMVDACQSILACTGLAPEAIRAERF
jgi:ferredoxin-NADP reductase